jgi:hypothetical protein
MTGGTLETWNQLLDSRLYATGRDERDLIRAGSRRYAQHREHSGRRQ